MTMIVQQYTCLRVDSMQVTKHKHINVPELCTVYVNVLPPVPVSQCHSSLLLPLLCLDQVCTAVSVRAKHTIIGHQASVITTSE
jgi:hypothetical protein